MTITRENRRDNQEWTIEIYRQHWAQNIQRRQTQQNHRTLIKGNNKITELRTIYQRESQNS
jgi:hypothetical protein